MVRPVSSMVQSVPVDRFGLKSLKEFFDMNQKDKELLRL
jgi:hypothetical protein